MNNKFKIMTYNVGLLDYKIFNYPFFSNPRHSDKRYVCIPDALIKEDTDIICLQECYDDSHYDFFVNKLKHIYPFSARVKSNKGLKITNGLVVFSKWEILESLFEEFTSVTLLEYYFGSKGFLYCKINSPLFDQPINIINIHTSSGGIYFTSGSHFVDLLRNNEIDHIFYFIKENNLVENTFLVGDFNFDKISRKSTAYEYLLKNFYYDMFTDTYSNHKIHDASNNNPNNYTWENTNYLNSTNYHKDESSGRLDYVFISSKDIFFQKWSLYNSYITFSEPDVFINNELSITKSDHYALICEFSKYI